MGSTLSVLTVGVLGGFGQMASPMSYHWKPDGPVKVIRVHDRGGSGEKREQTRKAWLSHGAKLVGTLEELVGDGNLDGIFVCCGKNGDDVGLIATLAKQFSKAGSKDKFICHMSTVSVGFSQIAYEFCKSKKVRYVNYPLTGGPKGAEEGKMLILGSGDKSLFERLSSSLSFLGIPKYFGESVSAGTEVKFMGHLMVYNGLIGICSAVALHADSFMEGVVGGTKQGEFFDFLNAGAGGTRQWDLILASGIKHDIWNVPFPLRYGSVDAIYTADLCITRRTSWLTIESIIQVALAFSYIMNNLGQDLATHAIVREMVSARASELNQFMLKHSGPRNDPRKSLDLCIRSFPDEIRKSIALDLTLDDFVNKI